MPSNIVKCIIDKLIMKDKYINILIYGLQRSGTNFLEVLLKNRYQINIVNINSSGSNPSAKHFRMYDNKKIIPHPFYNNDLIFNSFIELESALKQVPDYYFVISKDPYSWYLSYIKWAKKCDWPKVDHHYIQEYNLFYGKLMEFSQQTDKIIFVKYVDLLIDLDGKMKSLETITGLKKKKKSEFLDAKIESVPQSDVFTEQKYNYYTNSAFLDEYPRKSLDEMNSLIDRQVVEALGYKIHEAG